MANPLTLRSQREINLIRQAGLVVWRAHHEAAQLVAPGTTTAQLDAAVERVFVEAGATPLFKGFPGPIPFPAVTCISVNEQVVHGIPGSRVLKEGDIVSVDTGCKLRGWCADAAVTYAVGKVSPEAERLLDVTRGALALAIELLGCKQRWSEVAREMQKLVHEAGFSAVEDFAGHGIGREMHEEPRVPNYYKAREFQGEGDFLLRPGLVLAIEPMVNIGTKNVKCLPDHWTQVTADGKLSAHFEHTVALTKDGPRQLTGPPE